jgi:hypothetical protein
VHHVVDVADLRRLEQHRPVVVRRRRAGIAEDDVVGAHDAASGHLRHERDAVGDGVDEPPQERVADVEVGLPAVRQVFGHRSPPGSGERYRCCVSASWP